MSENLFQTCLRLFVFRLLIASRFRSKEEVATSSRFQASHALGRSLNYHFSLDDFKSQNDVKSICLEDDKYIDRSARSLWRCQPRWQKSKASWMIRAPEAHMSLLIIVIIHNEPQSSYSTPTAINHLSDRQNRSRFYWNTKTSTSCENLPEGRWSCFYRATLDALNLLSHLLSQKWFRSRSQSHWLSMLSFTWLHKYCSMLLGAIGTTVVKG